jgi:hypothetical protein
MFRNAAKPAYSTGVRHDRMIVTAILLLLPGADDRSLRQAERATHSFFDGSYLLLAVA